MKYPEHEKLKANEASALTLSGFLDFLSEQGWSIAEYPEHSDYLHSIRQGPDQIIGLYLGIDPKKLSKEKDAMVKELQKVANKKPATNSRRRTTLPD